MSEFNLDNLKKTWQEQDVQPKYTSTDISQMLTGKSRNYVKFIFWISLAEFILFFFLNIYYIFQSENENSFFNILQKLGVQENAEIKGNFEHLYFGLKIVSLIITAYFVIQFYINYKKIKIQDNLKLLILQIVKFRKTVNVFIFTNIFLLILFTAILTFFIFSIFSSQSIALSHPVLLGFLTGAILTTVLAVGLIWLYYKVVYGIIMKRLGKNLKQLQSIEAENN